MEYKILEQNGTDNENIDGAAFNNFCAGGQDGIVKGVLNECEILSLENSVSISTGELIIHGIRVKLTESSTFSFAVNPSTSIDYQIVADLTLNDSKEILFNMICRVVGTPLVQDDLYKLGSGHYQVEIVKFTHTPSGITGATRTLDVITGGLNLSKLGQNIMPEAAGIYNIGGRTRPWNNIYTQGSVYYVFNVAGTMTAYEPFEVSIHQEDYHTSILIQSTTSSLHMDHTGDVFVTAGHDFELSSSNNGDVKLHSSNEVFIDAKKSIVLYNNSLRFEIAASGHEFHLKPIIEGVASGYVSFKVEPPSESTSPPTIAISLGSVVVFRITPTGCYIFGKKVLTETE